MSFLEWARSPTWIGRTPILSTFLLEFANVGQLWRMWHEHTAAGQNVWSWVSVNLALWLWLNFYEQNPDQNYWAIRSAQVGIGLNGAVILTVLYFRYLV